MTRLLRTASLVLSTGFVLFAFSERVFWSFLRDGDDAGAMIGGWLIYAVLAYLMLAAGRLFRAGDSHGWVVLGALFGWLDEGVYAVTLYGDPSMPFPLTIAWTGLAWHALLSVTVGLFWLRRCLQEPTPWPSLALAILIGLFWGGWASGWAGESPPLFVSPLVFLIHAGVTSAGLILAQIGITAGQARDFAPSRIGLFLAGGLVVAFFAGVSVPAVPWSPVVLLPLLAMLSWALVRARGPASEPDALDDLGRPVRAVNLLCLMTIPLVATGAYSWLLALGSPLPAHPIVAVASSVTGTAALVVALYRSMSRRRAPQTPAALAHR